MSEQNQLIGVGKVSDVYLWDEGWVLKLFHTGFPIEYVEHEQAITAGVRALGLSVPDVGEVVTIDTRHGLLLEHIDGISLLEIWLGDVNNFRPIFDTLAQLHYQIHSASDPLPDMLPTQQEWLHGTIAESDLISDVNKTRLLSLLETLPTITTLCHGDLHPGNVLMRPDGTPVVIDWFSTTVGDFSADIARTALLIHHVPLPAPIQALLPPMLRRVASDYFQSAYFALQPQPAPHLSDWQELVKYGAIAEGLLHGN